MLSKYLHTWWCAPCTAFLIYFLMMGLRPPPIWMDQIWQLAIAGHVLVIVYQLFNRRWKTVLFGFPTLGLHVICWWFKAIQTV